MASADQYQVAERHPIVSRLAGIAPGQALRILFGIASLATVVWITVPHLISTVSSNAAINAISKIGPSDGCGRVAVPLALQRCYNFLYSDVIR
jgi:hypothetical protein